MVALSARKLTIRLYPDRDGELLMALDAIPPRQQATVLRQALTWYLVPGGFGEIISRLDHLTASSQANLTGSSVCSPNLTAVTDNALKQMGWDDDDD